MIAFPKYQFPRDQARVNPCDQVLQVTPGCRPSDLSPDPQSPWLVPRLLRLEASDNSCSPPEAQRASISLRICHCLKAILQNLLLLQMKAHFLQKQSSHQSWSQDALLPKHFLSVLCNFCLVSVELVTTHRLESNKHKSLEKAL